MGGSAPRYWAFSRQTNLAHVATTPRSATTEPLVTQGFRRIAGRQLRRLRRGLVRLNHEAVLETLRSLDRKSTRLNSSHRCISYAVFCLKKKNPDVSSA